MFPTRCRLSICQPDGRLDRCSGGIEWVFGGLPVLERLCTQWREWAGVAGDGLDPRRRVRSLKLTYGKLFRFVNNHFVSTDTPWGRATLSIVSRPESVSRLIPFS